MDERILDIEDFMNRVQDDKDLLFELLDIYVNDFHIKRAELKEAIEKGNAETVEHVAHFLKGSSGNISAKSLREIFSSLEKKGSQGVVDGLEGDLEEVDKKFEELAVCIGELRAKF